MIITDYCEQFYANQMDNLEEMNTFLETYQSPLTESGRNKKYEQTEYQQWKWISNFKKTSQQTEVQDQTSQVDSTKHLKKS